MNVLYPLRSGYLSYPVQKAVELNLLCSECPHRRFFLPERPRSVSFDQDPFETKKTLLARNGR